MCLMCICMVLQYLTGYDHFDACRVYLQGASISHTERRSLYMRLECMRMVLQYLTGYEDHYRCV